jgi:hypothetical protein
MKEFIKYNELDDSERKYYLDRAVSMKLQEYIRMYNKLKRAGVTDLEILKLRGMPLTYDEVNSMLELGKILIRLLDNDCIEMVTRK